MRTFAEELEKHLQKSGLSMNALARKLGINESTVRSWMRGDTKPRGETLLALADILGVDATQLLKPKRHHSPPAPELCHR